MYKRQHCKSSKEVLKEMGFQAAFTCAEKVNVLPNKGGDLDWLYTLGRYKDVYKRQVLSILFCVCMHQSAALYKKLIPNKYRCAAVGGLLVA